jgi:hypothetical protein
VDPRTDDDPEALLQALLTGGADEQSPAVQRLFAAHAELRERWARLRELTRELDAAGADARAAIAAAAATTTPHDDQVRDLILRWQQQPSRFRPRLVIAAAVLLAALLCVWWLRPSRPDRDSILGPASGSLSPKGEVSDYALFQWNVSRPPEGSYVLRFFADDPAGRFLFAVTDLRDTQWRPDAARRSQMTPRMAWQVEVLDVDGRAMGGAGPVAVWLQR